MINSARGYVDNVTGLIQGDETCAFKYFDVNFFCRNEFPPTQGQDVKKGRQQQQKRILIIDDEQDIATILRMTLEDNGFKADFYTDSVLAYQNFREGLYDLVILDIKMPEVDGFHLYQKIKRTDSKVKICFLTASEYYYEQFRKEAGFSDFKQELFLRKPIETEDLVSEIKKMLEPG